jgi:hypothetical protein
MSGNSTKEEYKRKITLLIVLFFTVQHSLAYIGAIAMHATNQYEWLRRKLHMHLVIMHVCMQPRNTSPI